MSNSSEGQTDSKRKPTAFRWAYVPLGIGGLYTLFALAFSGIVRIQQSMLDQLADSSDQLGIFFAFHEFANLYWSLALGIGLLAAFLGLAMLRKWSVVAWVLGVVLSVGLVVYAVSYAIAASELVTSLYSQIAEASIPPPFGSIFAVQQQLSVPIIIALSAILFALPGVAILVSVIMDQRPPERSGKAAVNVPPR